MVDSLDYIRKIAINHDSAAHETCTSQLLAIAMLKLADENTDLRQRVCSLELAGDSHLAQLKLVSDALHSIRDLIANVDSRVGQLEGL